MQYREYGKSAAMLSTLGFGCMRFPAEDGRVDEEHAVRLIHRALRLGVNFFDTAVGYCNEQSAEGPTSVSN